MWKKKILVFFIVLVFSLFGSLNSEAIIEEGGNITEDTVWMADDVHLVTTNIAVAAGITLTIEAGAIVKFNSGTSISINQGILVAVGELGNKIVFTSYRDDEFGGDTNGDGLSQGQPGDWNRIYLNQAVACAHQPCEPEDTGTELKNCVIRYGGSGNQGSLYLYRSDISVISNEISEGNSFGLYVYNCSPLIEGNTISSNGRESYGSGLYLYNYYSTVSPVIRNNTITGSYTNGIHSLSSTPLIEGNTITDNGAWGIYFNSNPNTPEIKKNIITGNYRSMLIPASAMPGSDAAVEDKNTLAPNTINGIWIRGSSRSSDLDFERLYAGESYEINTYQIYDTLTMASGSKLTVAPGVVVKFYSGAGLDINGALDAQGTSDLPIVFTSYKDDRYGGDLNLDGTATTPANGDWRGIYFSNQADDASCVIDHAVIRFGGSANSGMVYSRETDFTISSSLISNSSTNGIRTYQASLTFSNNEIFGNSGDGLRFESTGSHTVTGSRIFANVGDGIEVLNSSNLTAGSSEIFGNLGYGIRSSSSGTVTATGNWWGGVDGPGGEGPGSGDQISTSVTYDPFLTDGTEFSYFDAGPNTGEGTITAPTVTRGTDTSEFGSDARTRMLYDLEEVILDYSVIDAVTRYEIFVTYCNGDDTSGVGGNIQRLTDGDDLEIHGNLNIPIISSPTQYYYYLMQSSHDDGTLRLKFIRENGFRAVVSQVWLVERSDTTDTTAPGSTIISPSSSDHLTGSIAEVTGTSTDDTGSGVLIVEVGIDDGSGISWSPVTQLRSNGTWSYRWSLPSDGDYTLYSRSRDRAGNLEIPGTGVAVVVNRAPPVPATSMSAFDTPEDSGGSITILWNLSLDDGAGVDDVTGYDIERSEDPNGTFSLAGSVSAGTTSYADTTTTNGTQYYYRVITKDQAGNWSVSSVYGPVISIDNDTPDSSPPEDVTSLTGTPGNECVYLTWTRSADSALDLVNQLLDISTDGSSWGSAITLGKEADLYLADGLINGTGYYFRIRVKDSSNNVSVSGIVIGPVTPSTTAVSTVSGTISSDTTWAAGVYYVSNNITINSGVVLTILPGVIVKFASTKSMTVNGTLTAVGEADNKVVFTAWTDDGFGGDSNGDGASTGTPGYWGKVQFTNTSMSSRLEDVVVRYGGSGGNGNIYIDQADVPVISSEISHGSSYGIRTNSCSPLIEGNTIADNESHGLYHYYGSPTVRNNTITHNHYGIYTTYATPTIDGNTITGNAKPVRLPFSSLPGPSSGNTLAPNTKNQIEFWGNTLTRSLVLTADPVNVYYQVGGNATVAAGVKLTVEPGVVWKFANNTRVDVNGALYAVGTSSDKIVFTSYRDDSNGGDTNGDGYSTGQPGDWNRIYFSDSVIDFLARLEHVIIRYGGSGNNGNLYLYRSNISVVSSEITNGSHFGIYSYESSPLIQDSLIADNGNSGVYIYSYGYPRITGNEIRGNAHGIYNDYNTATVTIQNNEITDNIGWGIYYRYGQSTPVITGNTITGNYRNMIIPANAVPNTTDGNILGPNTINGIWIRGSSRSSDLDFERLYAGKSYEINTYQIYDTLTMSSGSKLTVAPGVVVKFYTGAGLTINGALDAQGTSQLPVVFTSYKDDRYGGDLNLDGYGASPVNGDWRGIYFTNSADDANCVIDHAVIRFGGSANSGMVYSYLTDFSISNSIFSNSSTNGIRTYQASLTLSNNEIFSNSGDGLRFESTGSHTVTGCRLFANVGDGIEVLNSANLAATGSEIFGNMGYGIRSSSSGTVTATGNWWGAVDGPSGIGTGAGDEVNNQVDYEPYLTDGTEFFYFNAGGTNHYGYGILQPVVSGSASTEWGTGDTRSFLYSIDPQRIVAEYMDLSSTSSYKILVTYLNQDPGGGTQSLTDISGKVVHPALGLPTSNPVSYFFPICRELIKDGNLTLHFNGLSGLRTVVSGIFLMKDDTSEGVLPVVHLNSPANGAILRQETMTISGTATDVGSGVMTVEIGIQKEGEAQQWYPATSITGGGLWTFRWSPSSLGQYTLTADAIDFDGNRSSAPETAIVTVDGAAPDPVSDLFAQGLSGTSGTIQVSWTLSSDDGSGADDVLRYEIFRSESQYTGFVLVGQVGAGMSQFNDSTVTDEVDYYYYVSTVDLAGYRSDSPVFGPLQSTGAVDDTAPEDITNLSASATQVSGGSPSVLLTWTGSVDSEGDLVNQLIYISTDGGTSWADAISLGKHARNYQANGLTAGQGYTFKITTIDEVPNESIGSTVDITPTGAENETISLGGTLSDDTTLYAGVYYISSNLTIPVGTTLTIGPGAILKFAANKYMTVNGTLTAVGEAGNKVVFTAWTDDSFGGDSNGDGASTGTPGYWNMVQFTNTSVSSRLEDVVERSRYAAEKISK